MEGDQATEEEEAVADLDEMVAAEDEVVGAEMEEIDLLRCTTTIEM